MSVVFARPQCVYVRFAHELPVIAGLNEAHGKYVAWYVFKK